MRDGSRRRQGGKQRRAPGKPPRTAGSSTEEEVVPEYVRRALHESGRAYNVVRQAPAQQTITTRALASTRSRGSR